MLLWLHWSLYLTIGEWIMHARFRLDSVSKGVSIYIRFSSGMAMVFSMSYTKNHISKILQHYKQQFLLSEIEQV